MLTLTGSNNVLTTGLGSGSAVPSSSEISANRMYIYKSRPYFAVNSSSPSGNLNPSSNTNVAIFDVTADAGDDITFDDGISSVIEVQVDATIADTVSSNYVTLTLRDEDNNILGVDTMVVGVAGLMDGTTFTFNATNSFGGTDNGGTTTYPWTIADGTTEKLKVYADTSMFEDDGDFIQVWLSDDADANCTFGIDGAGTHAEGPYIFKGDIYAGSFVNPS